ncbi:hypothetical protein ACP8Y2_06845 [Herpetosiphon llansteffanensis]
MSDINTVLRQHVKHTPELPQHQQRVMLWRVDRWIYTFRDGNHWIGLMDSILKDVEYWLPLPTFDPTPPPLEPMLNPCPRCKTTERLTAFPPSWITPEWRVWCVACQEVKHYPDVTSYEQLVTAWNADNQSEDAPCKD